MYFVINQNSIRSQFVLFIDAWMDAILNTESYCEIIGPDGKWTVNHPGQN